MSDFDKVTERWIKDNYDNRENNRYYEDQYLLGYPDFTVKKLGITKKRGLIQDEERILTLFNNLPPKEERTREQVFKWMKDSELKISDFGYVGW